MSGCIGEDQKGDPDLPVIDMSCNNDINERYRLFALGDYIPSLPGAEKIPQLIPK
jgi:hypothetical protein